MNPLEQRLRARAPLPFREFMQAALFDPEQGYYSKHIRTVGRRGDFSTSTTLSNRLGRAIASWLRQRWSRERKLARRVIEIGAGDGALAESTMAALGLLGRRRVHYHIVETSEPLALAQRTRLAKQRNLHWHRTTAEALAACGGEAMIISNELVDAFPATLLEWDRGTEAWRELCLHWDDGSWEAEPGEIATLPAGSSLAGGHRFQDGQRVERHDSYLEWLADWLPGWRAGTMLTIDYGDVFPELYHRRPRGTLRAYFAQQRLEPLAEVLARPGRQDITADVDFTDLQQRGEELGLRTGAFTTQAEFISTFAPPSRRPSAADATMVDPYGAGAAFKVLEQSPG